ncbi:unnamed protein product [Discosporangium mesarthrocarpum]
MLWRTRSSMTVARGANVCTVDATGTIMRVKGHIPRIYLGVLEEHLGVSEGELGEGVSEDALLASFASSMKKRSRDLPSFGAAETSSQDWWEEIVRASFLGAGVPSATLDPVFDGVFRELYHDIFTGERAWELLPGARQVLANLRAWCDSEEGPAALGVVSNFDERLHLLLKNLGVYDSFDFVITSREFGVEKPSPLIFMEAMRRAGQTPGNGALGVHIGDTYGRDVVGASAAGWTPILVGNNKKKRLRDGEEGALEHVCVGDLRQVPQVLGIVDRSAEQG